MDEAVIKEMLRCEEDRLGHIKDVLYNTLRDEFYFQESHYTHLRYDDPLYMALRDITAAAKKADDALETVLTKMEEAANLIDKKKD